MECCNPGIVSEDWGAKRSRKRVAKILAEWFMSRREAIAVAAVAPKQCVSLEKFIGFELSLVAQVEQVYVDRADNGKEFTVTTVINERDPNIRAQIYEREKAIIDAHANTEFSFHIATRMDHDAAEVVKDVGQLVFKR